MADRTATTDVNLPSLPLGPELGPELPDIMWRRTGSGWMADAATVMDTIEGQASTLESRHGFILEQVMVGPSQAGSIQPVYADGYFGPSLRRTYTDDGSLAGHAALKGAVMREGGRDGTIFKAVYGVIASVNPHIRPMYYPVPFEMSSSEYHALSDVIPFR